MDTYERTLRGAAAPEFDPDKDETDRYEERLRSESGLEGLFRDLDEDRKRR